METRESSIISFPSATSLAISQRMLPQPESSYDDEKEQNYTVGTLGEKEPTLQTAESSVLFMTAPEPELMNISVFPRSPLFVLCSNFGKLSSSSFLRKNWPPTPLLLPGKFHGWRSLVGYSPWGCKESDTTGQLHFLSIVPFGEGNGNPLQCSCLESPMDRGAWWATVYGVAKSQTRLSNQHTHSFLRKYL